MGLLISEQYSRRDGVSNSVSMTNGVEAGITDEGGGWGGEIR